VIDLSIPGRGNFVLKYLVLDVNGTLAVDGTLLEGVAERLDRLREQLEIHLVTADTHGTQSTIEAELRVTATHIRAGQEREQKAALINQLSPEHVVAIGNGANDIDMLKDAVIGIAVLGPEGASAETLLAADVVVTSISDAFDLLLIPKRLIATLRR
jgi:P-type E1-E2 ATPase